MHHLHSSYFRFFICREDTLLYPVPRIKIGVIFEIADVFKSPENPTSPATSSFDPGFVVPIPTLPPLNMLQMNTAALERRLMFDDYMPVVLHPTNLSVCWSISRPRAPPFETTNL